MIQGVLKYCSTSDRWVFEGNNGSSFDLHCGNVMEIKVCQQYRPARLELSDDWYVIFSDTSFNLKHNSIYKARYR